LACLFHRARVGQELQRTAAFRAIAGPVLQAWLATKKSQANANFRR
jgi:hypothetical protein